MYLRAGKEISLVDCNTLLEDIFRLVNQINLLGDSVNVTFNTVGRYYKDKKDIFTPLFRVLWKELLMLY